MEERTIDAEFFFDNSSKGTEQAPENGRDDFLGPKIGDKYAGKSRNVICEQAGRTSINCRNLETLL